MSKKLKAALVSDNGTILWRFIIFCIIPFLCWTGNRLIDRVDRHDELIYGLQQCMSDQFAKKEDLYKLSRDTVSKDEFSALEDDIKSIQTVLNTELPKIQNYMGQFTEYLRTH